MKLATLKTDTPDGTLVIVSEDLMRAVKIPDLAPTLQYAMDHWAELEPRMRAVYRLLNAGEILESFHIDPGMFLAPLPRAYQRIASIAYINHLERRARARHMELPNALREKPQMYHSSSDRILSAQEPLYLPSESWGMDFEGCLAVITDAVPAKITKEEAAEHVRLLTMVSNVVYRQLAPDEFSANRGQLQSNPSCAMATLAVTPDTLGDAWHGGKVHLPIVSQINGNTFGKPDAGIGMTFSFPELIAHASQTRGLSGGTVLTTGPVSNTNFSIGTSCIAERRMLEVMERGSPRTPYLRVGDEVRIEMASRQGQTCFGAIRQKVAPPLSDETLGVHSLAVAEA